VDRRRHQSIAATIVKNNPSGRDASKAGPSDGCDQSARRGPAAENNDGIIIPPRPFAKPDRFIAGDRPRTDLLKLAILITVVGSMLLGGAGLWQYLAKNPLQSAALAPQELPAGPAAQANQLEPASKPPKSQPDFPPPPVDPKTVEQQLAEFLEAGQASLAQGNGPLAQREFTAALMIDASNPTAQRGLQRSNTIEAVMRRIASGRQHEQNNDLSAALTDYREAVQLDPHFDEARQAVRRVENLIDTQRFQQLLSEGLAAFHRNDFQSARTKLQQAKAIKPDSRETLAALAQVDAAMRLSRIDILRQDAQTAELNEDWESVVRSYQAVLDLDPNLQFAARGKERAIEQVGLKKRIAFFLEKPAILQSDTQLQNALRLLAEAAGTDPKGPRLAAQLKELESLIILAQTPVKMTIASDNLTEIIVYKVGKLGKLTSHELSLRPGTYTVVGARDGYQDVRQEVVLKPGQEALRITVACRVKI
jgi:hypothetical protein